MSNTASAQSQTVDPASGAVSWETQIHGVTLSLTQILPDQARAFYLNRGLSAVATEPYAKACVYMMILRNDSAPGVVQFRLKDWSVVSTDQSRPPLSVEEWLKRLEGYDLTQAAMIAFRWAQFPPEQAYQPGGDWNQGMLTTGLEADTVFDLIARWDVAGESYQGLLRNVRCAP
ncbi:MAG: hypothetical protein KZQ89_07860 [Candidatus Thiodiazotropha sp. (ex Lucinoma kastoroae)]|nr:hypothetical protein [Candidatus Thiodiazotropha sp. (ex Rostrolucina anterorostrata)]MCU7847910.1 hypothetical protein [Candidatus Thiodiazotropha sp. (ex Lucinoma kastoroae)]